MRDILGKEKLMIKTIQLLTEEKFCPYDKESKRGFPGIHRTISSHHWSKTNRQLRKPLKTLKRR